MNIKEAKEQIKNAIAAYFTQDSFSNYLIRRTSAAHFPHGRTRHR